MTTYTVRLVKNARSPGQFEPPGVCLLPRTPPGETRFPCASYDAYGRKIASGCATCERTACAATGTWRRGHRPPDPEPLPRLRQVAHPVRCLDTGDVFASTTEAGRWARTHPTNIRQAIRQRTKNGGPLRAGGFRWEYVDPLDEAESLDLAECPEPEEVLL